jgi:hypothetical protein
MPSADNKSYLFEATSNAYVGAIVLSSGYSNSTSIPKSKHILSNSSSAFLIKYHFTKTSSNQLIEKIDFYVHSWHFKI